MASVTLDMAYQILLGLVVFFGGMWVKRLHKDMDGVGRRIDQIRDNYQRKDDAGAQAKQLMDMLREVKTHVQRIEDKLDRKADKS